MNWESIKNTGKPVVLYGTGNAADRVISGLSQHGCRISGVFASDGFVRKRVFAGFRVMSYVQARDIFGDMTVLLCFGSHIPSVMDNIRRIATEQELYAPDLPVAGSDAFTENLLNEHKNEICRIRERLEDDVSRYVLDSVIKYKQTWNIKYLADCETCEDENWRLLGLSEKERFLDLGAYNGDTVMRFIACTCGRYESITALEPDSRNFRKLAESTSELENIICINAAAGKTPGKVLFDRNAGRGGAVHTGAGETAMKTVDGVADENGFSFIKMDLEGMEADAIDGAAGTIRKFRPAMLVSAYHRCDDLWTIPEKVLEICPDYKVYLRKDPCIPAWEVNYYFVR